MSHPLRIGGGLRPLAGSFAGATFGALRLRQTCSRTSALQAIPRGLGEHVVEARFVQLEMLHVQAGFVETPHDGRHRLGTIIQTHTQ